MTEKERILITGFSGFVSKHFLDYLEQNRIYSTILGIDINEDIPFKLNSFEYLDCSFKKLDLLDKNSVEEILIDFQPDYILHLASYSSVALSWKQPVESFTNNTNIFLNLIESVRHSNLKCRIISVGSSEEYGNVTKDLLPLTENLPLNPISPYAVARVSQEMLSKIYSDSYNLDIIMTRSFNHIGTHQKDIFVIPSFVKKMIAIKNGNNKNIELTTGDTSIIRDFVDVRAVAEAYYLLFKKGQKGEIYNICSGVGVSLIQVIDTISSILDIRITQKTDANLVRPNDNKIIIGSNEKLKLHTGWKNRYNLKESLTDIINYYQN